MQAPIGAAYRLGRRFRDTRACRAALALTSRHKMTKFYSLGSCMMIEINYHAETLETAISEAIVTYLGYGMPAREIIGQLISRGFIRDPGNNAREDVVQRLADIAEQMHGGGPS